MQRGEGFISIQVEIARCLWHGLEALLVKNQRQRNVVAHRTVARAVASAVRAGILYTKCLISRNKSRIIWSNGRMAYSSQILRKMESIRTASKRILQDNSGILLSKSCRVFVEENCYIHTVHTSNRLIARS